MNNIHYFKGRNTHDQNMKNQFLLLVLAATFSFTSCGDDEKKVDPTPQVNRTELISANSWKLSKAVRTINGTDTDFTNNILACERDNIETFSANGIFISDEGSTKCNSSSPQTYASGTWMFTNNETKLKVSTAPGELEIVELISSKMVLKLVDSTQTITNTYIPNQ